MKEKNKKKQKQNNLNSVDSSLWRYYSLVRTILSRFLNANVASKFWWWSNFFEKWYNLGGELGISFHTFCPFWKDYGIHFSYMHFISQKINTTFPREEVLGGAVFSWVFSVVRCFLVEMEVFHLIPLWTICCFFQNLHDFTKFSKFWLHPLAYIIAFYKWNFCGYS